MVAAGVGVPRADAQKVNARPGLSGVDQYLETVPGATGAERPGGGNGPDGTPAPAAEVNSRARRIVPAPTLRALARAGKDGEEVKRLAAANGPLPTRGTAASRPLTGSSLGDGSSDGPIRSVADTLTGSSGAGIVFPLGLALVTIVLAVAGLRRRRAS